MKIEHTTYNEAHGLRASLLRDDLPNVQRPSKQPKTTAERVKGFFSAKSQRTGEVQGNKTVRFDLPTATPRNTARTEPSHVHIGQVLAQEEARFKLQERERKAYEQAVKQAKKHEKPTSLAAHVPLYDWKPSEQTTRSSYQILGCDRPEKRIAKIPRPVRSKFNTSPVRSKFNTSTTPSTPRVADKRGPRAGTQGRLEHSPNTKLFLGPRPPSPGAQRPQKRMSKPPPKELRSVVDNLNTGADLLDAKRRELKSAFQKNAEKFRRSYGGDSDSDESFFCSGDPASTANSKKQSTPRIHLPTRGDGEVRSCRLCHVRSPAGPRGICSECEITYCSPQPDVFDDSVNIPPTTPLKIRKSAVALKSGLGLSTSGQPHSPPPLPPVKESDMRRKVHDVRAKRTVVTTPLDHRQSHRAVFENVENISPLKRQPSRRVVDGRVESVGKAKKTVSKSTRWPVEGMREAYGNGGKGFPRLSPTKYSSTTSDSPNSSDGDQQLLLTGKREDTGYGGGLKKSDSFYVFYDSMLRDLGVSTPKSGVSAKRYDGL